MSSAISATTGTPLDAKFAAIVLEEVRAVARERSAGLNLDSRLGDLGLDSLELMDVVARVENACRVRFSEVELSGVESCRDLAILTQRVQARPPSIASERSVDGWRLEESREYQQFQNSFAQVAAAGEADPYFAVHDGSSGSTIRIDGRELINFSGNNYLGLSGDADVIAAAKEALDRYGTSVSASRLVSGTRPVHIELEQEIADFLGTDDAITFTSGQATNATVLGHLLGRGDLILHDELAHNSILVGARLSGATRRAFPHNSWQALDDILAEVRHEYRKVLIAIEGVYSMDGDFPDVPRFVEIKRRHRAYLYLDEAHSIGTLGATGRGIGELQRISRGDIDLWMGTLSKALGACGGYIAGSGSLVRYLKYTCPGVIYTVGLSPPSAAAALTALRKLRDSNSRVATLQSRANQFLDLVQQRGLNTGLSNGTAIVPVLLGNSLQTLATARKMRDRGISVQPILPPAVPESGARLRFFLSALHTPEQLQSTAEALAEITATR
jgi:8-amino-7-oxononanoate synthase